MSAYALEILILLLLVTLNGVLAMSELAIVSARRSRLEQRAAEGSRGARAALELADDPNRFLATVQVGITLIGILAGAFGGATLARSLASWLETLPVVYAWADVLAVLVVVSLVTYLSLVVGELVPKRLALSNPEAVAAMVARPMQRLSVVTRPVVWLLSISTEVLLRVLPNRATGDPSVTAEDVRLLLQESLRSGILPGSAHRLVAGAFDLRDQTAGQLAIPRHRIAMLDISAPLEDTLATLRAVEQPIFLIYRGDPDNVLGVVTADRLVAAQASGPLDLSSLVTDAPIVPSSLPAPAVLDRLAESEAPAAIVVDEYGSVEGLLTRDVIWRAAERRRARVPGVRQLGAGRWQLPGDLDLNAARELLDCVPFPRGDDGEPRTVGGFVMQALDRVPQTGDCFVWQGLRFEVTAMDRRRVAGVRVERVSQREPRPAGTVSS